MTVMATCILGLVILAVWIHAMCRAAARGDEIRRGFLNWYCFHEEISDELALELEGKERQKRW